MRNRISSRRARNPNDGEGRRSDEAASRDSRAHAIAVDCLRRRMAGEVISDAALLADHADLEPELSAALAHLQTVEQALFHAQPPASSATGEQDHAATQSPASTASSRDRRRNDLSVRCPHCHAPSDVPATGAWDDLACSACGSHFNLIDLGASGSGQSVMTTVGHFELVEPLGAGGFGTVWKALDKELDRWVAIKIPRGDRLTSDQAEQFFREARAVAELRHPHIVSVHAVGRDEGKLYIVSDYVAGGSLAEWLADQRMTSREAATLCQKIALALEHAHQAGVVHRDLKPANILLSVEGEPYLTDFGLARRDLGETTVTLEGQLLGTPAYMSPEQARGEAHGADHRADIYSLGVILFELLTGELPFRGSTRMLLKQILEDEPPNPRSLNGGVPRDLATIGLKCLEKDPGRRYASAQELADDLGRFLRREPISARPVSRAERTWRWCRRRPAVAGLTAAVAAALVIIAVLSTAYSMHSRAAVREAHWQQYLSDMHSAAKAWDEGDVRRVVELLQRNRPAPGEEDLRRFEWHYLWRQCQPSLAATTFAHGYGVSALALTSDGSKLVVAVQSPTTGDVINIWDIARRVKLRSLSGANFSPAIAISPDDRLMATSNVESSPTLWDLATGNRLHELIGHTGTTRGVAFSPDGRLVATSGDDGAVRLWNTQTGELVDTFENERVGLDYGSALDSYTFDYGLAFAPDGQTLVAGARDGNVKFWNVATQILMHTLPAHTGPVYTLAISRDGQILTTGGADHIVKVWNFADRTLRTSLVGHTDSISGVDISPDAAMIASAGRGDGTVRIWDAETGDERFTFKGHSGSVARVRFAGNNRVVSGGADGAVRVWDLTRKYDVDVLRVHKSGSWSIVVGRDGKTVAAGAYSEPTIKVWDLASGTLLKSHTAATEDAREGMDALAISPDGKWLALGGNLTQHIELWNPVTEETVPLQHLGSDSGAITSLAWSADGRTLVSCGTGSNDVIIWDTTSGQERSRLPRHTDWMCSVALSPDDRTLATRCQDGTLQIWDPATGALRNTINIPAYWFSPLAFSLDGSLLACADVHNVIQIRETTNWQVVQSATGHTGKVKGLAFSPDGRTLASASNDATIRLWEVATGEQRCTLRGHRGEVEVVKFTPDGQTLASSSLDGTVRLWRAASPTDVRVSDDE